MKRFLISSLSLIILSTISFAETPVQGSLSSDTRWDKANSPYRIQGAVSVPKGTTLSIGPGAKVIWDSSAQIEIVGSLKVTGTAVHPVILQMPEGDLSTLLFINGGEASISNARISGGVFLAKDATLKAEGTDFTRGSGIYLQGSTKADLSNNKIYGNASGLTLDGDKVEADLTFNTFVHNTYGLLLKQYASLKFENNSVHDNQKYDVVNKVSNSVALGGNYWGTTDEATVNSRVEGKTDLAPMRSLKEVLRVFIMTQLPNLPKNKIPEIQQKAREERTEATRIAKLRKKSKTITRPAAAVSAIANVAPAQAEEPAPVAEAPASVEAPASDTVVVGSVEAPVAAASASDDLMFSGNEVTTTAEPEAPATEAPAASSADLGALDLTAPAAASAPSSDIPLDLGTMEPAPPVSTNAAPPSADLGIPALGDMAPPADPVDQSLNLDLGPLDAAPATPAPATEAPASAPAASAGDDLMGMGAPAAPAGADAGTNAPLAPADNLAELAAPSMDNLNIDLSGGEDKSAVNPTPEPTPSGTSPSAPPPPDLGNSFPSVPDIAVEAPKDLDLPPMDDLGTINLDQ